MGYKIQTLFIYTIFFCSYNHHTFWPWSCGAIHQQFDNIVWTKLNIIAVFLLICSSWYWNTLLQLHIMGYMYFQVYKIDLFSYSFLVIVIIFLWRFSVKCTILICFSLCHVSLPLGKYVLKYNPNFYQIFANLWV